MFSSQDKARAVFFVFNTKAKAIPKIGHLTLTLRTQTAASARMRSSKDGCRNMIPYMFIGGLSALSSLPGHSWAHGSQDCSGGSALSAARESVAVHLAVVTVVTPRAVSMNGTIPLGPREWESFLVFGCDLWRRVSGGPVRHQ